MQITRAYYLEINTIPLATPAWEVTDLSALLDDPSIRGSDRPLPEVDGVRPYRRRVDVTVLSFPLDVFGDTDSDGTAITDPTRGLVLHMDYLRDRLGLAEPTGDGTVQAIFHRGTLNPLYADVHFLGLQGPTTLSPYALRTTFDISIPAGRFEAAVS